MSSVLGQPVAICCVFVCVFFLMIRRPPRSTLYPTRRSSELYIRGKWERKQGKSHRPAIMRTIRRLRDRYRNYLADFYGYQGGIDIIHALEGMGEHAKSDF